VPVKRSPATPSPSATLALLRDRPAAGFDVLLIQRHRASKFAAGDFVFPGGKVEPCDNRDDAGAWCARLPEGEARRLLLDGDGALGYWIGAIREAFEEVGVLLAYDADGRPVRLNASHLAEHRRACLADPRAFWDMVRVERLTLATDRLVYFAHWITPEEQPLRFDTRFFAAAMPEGQEAIADEREVVDVRWLSPREAFEARERGEISLRLPTLKNLGLLDGAASASKALQRLSGREVSPIRPRLILDAAGKPERALLPGDPGYF
jgi:8-oxo-dGTP pyrophosphatase MutT (NUDIX family)